jgi:hypothetical protein
MLDCPVSSILMPSPPYQTMNAHTMERSTTGLTHRLGRRRKLRPSKIWTTVMSQLTAARWFVVWVTIN